MKNVSVDGKCKGWRGISSVEEDLMGHGRAPPLPAGFGLCWRKKGHRALSEKSSSLSKVQAEGALKWGGEEMAMKLDTWRGTSRRS